VYVRSLISEVSSTFMMYSSHNPNHCAFLTLDYVQGVLGPSLRALRMMISQSIYDGTLVELDYDAVLS